MKVFVVVCVLIIFIGINLHHYTYVNWYRALVTGDLFPLLWHRIKMVAFGFGYTWYAIIGWFTDWYPVDQAMADMFVIQLYQLITLATD